MWTHLFWSTRGITSFKNVETLPQKNDLSCFKSILVTGLWDIKLTSLLLPIQSCSSKFWGWSCIASKFDKGWRGDHQHKIMTRPFMPKYRTMSQVLLQLVVARSQAKVSTLYSDTKVGTGSLCARVFRWFREVLPTINSFAPFVKMASADGAKWMKDNLGTQSVDKAPFCTVPGN